jgi:tRNA A-37 threonylcarbamoyl transferase component Bud32
MLALNFDSDEDEKYEKEENTIEKIIDEKMNEGTAKDIAYEIATKIKEDDVENSLGYLFKIHNLKPIVLHKGRVFDAGMPKNPKYDTYVYNIDNTQILKIINCDCGAPESYMIIKELAYQKYASELSINCEFETPDILDYGRIMINEDMRENQRYSAVLENYTYDCIWFILMNKMNYTTLAEGVKSIDLMNEETCNNLSNKINTVRRCMEQNNLYHNDYHEENILIDADNKIGIIDFGLADTEPSDFTKSWEYTCNKLINLKRKSTVKSPISVATSFDNDSKFGNDNLFGEYGGNIKKRTRRRKTNRRTSSRRRTVRRKTSRRRKTKKYKK